MEQTTFEAGPLISITELAKRTDMPVSWLKSATKKGQIPGLLVGRNVKYSLTAVQLALQAMATKAVPQVERNPNIKPPLRRRQASEGTPRAVEAEAVAVGA